MKTVRDLLGDRPKDIPSVSADANVFAAMTLMTEKRIGSLVVLERKRLVGMLHERDCIEKILLWGQRSRDTKVREVMRQTPMTVRLDDSVETCVLYLLTEQATHLPVVEKGNVVGVVSLEAVLRLQLKRPGITGASKPKVKVATSSKNSKSNKGSKVSNKKNDRSWSGRVLN